MKPEPLQEYLIKPHARFEMQRRQITEEQVHHVLTTPGQIIEKTGGRCVYQSNTNLS